MQVPAHQALDSAVNPDLFALVASWVRENALGLVVAEVVADRTGQVRQNCVLLQLVGHNRSIGLSGLPDRKSLLAVPDCVPQGCFGTSKRHG